jgi:glutamyl-tRNA synthetase
MGLQKKAAVFDPRKLDWMNGQHLLRTPADELEPLLTPEIVAAGLATDADLRARREWYLPLIDLLRVRARTTHEIVKLAEPYLREDIAYDVDAVAKHWQDAPKVADLLEDVRTRLAATTEWDAALMEAALRAMAEERGTTAGKIFQPLRIALTGQVVSPGIFDVLMTLGRTRSLERIARAVETLRSAV